VRLKAEFVRQRVRHQTRDRTEGPGGAEERSGPGALGGEAAGGAGPLAPVASQALL
jgi:hypothetical protein